MMVIMIDIFIELNDLCVVLLPPPHCFNGTVVCIVFAYHGEYGCQRK
jgi:hypothetical protein